MDQAWITNRAEDTISVLDAQSLEPLAVLEGGEFPIRAEASADGLHVLITNREPDGMGYSPRTALAND